MQHLVYGFTIAKHIYEKILMQGTDYDKLLLEIKKSKENLEIEKFKFDIFNFENQKDVLIGLEMQIFENNHITPLEIYKYDSFIINNKKEIQELFLKIFKNLISDWSKIANSEILKNSKNNEKIEIELPSDLIIQWYLISSI